MQARPITTLADKKGLEKGTGGELVKGGETVTRELPKMGGAAASGKILVRGLGASPGMGMGKVRIVRSAKEKGFCAAGSRHDVFEVKGWKMGIAICADGSDRKNLQALVSNGAQVIYGPHANTTGGTVAGWYKFRSSWAGPDGWIADLKVYAALHNHAGLFNPEFDPPKGPGGNNGFASGAWVIGPDGSVLSRNSPPWRA